MGHQGLIVYVFSWLSQKILILNPSSNLSRTLYYFFIYSRGTGFFHVLPALIVSDNSLINAKFNK